MDCGRDHAWGSMAGAGRERAAVAAIWNAIEQLLTAPDKAAVLRHLTASLPPLESLATSELPGLAQLHARSASSMMATIRKLVPAVFDTHSGSTRVERLAQLSTAENALVASLIDLQLFHLQRTSALTAHSRQRLAQQPCTRTSSNCSITTTDAN